MVPHKRNSKVWPGLVTKEKTMKYPISAMCTVYMWVCGLTLQTVRGHITKGIIDPRTAILSSLLSSEVIRVQSLWECVKYRDKGKNNRGPRRVWSCTTVCVCVGSFSLPCGVLEQREKARTIGLHRAILKNPGSPQGISCTNLMRVVLSVGTKERTIGGLHKNLKMRMCVCVWAENRYLVESYERKRQEQ